jgi:NitT/TauT family transport system substrate-binding protein
MLKQFLLAVLAFLQTFTFGCPEILWAASTRAEVKAIYSSLSGSSVPIWIAQERGLYHKHGLTVHLIFTTGRRPTQALVAGEVQFISTAATASIPAVVAGGDLVILAGASNVSPLELFSRPDITLPEQLRGKRLGITTFGSATDTAARFALAKWGLKPGKDVVILQIGGVSEVLTALASGAIDAGIVSDPTSIAARKAGFFRLARMQDLGLKVQHAAIVAQRSYTQANPDLTERFLRAFGEAIRYFHTNREGTIEVMAKYLRRMDRETIAESYENHLSIIPKIPHPTVEGIQFILDELCERDPRARKFKPKDLIDSSFIEKLDREGFFRNP